MPHMADERVRAGLAHDEDLSIRDGHGIHAAHMAMIPGKVKHMYQSKDIAEHVNQVKMKPSNGVSRLHD